MSTPEQRDEAARFRALVHAVNPRARVVADPEGWPMTPGRLGRVEAVPGADRLAVYTTSMRQVAKLLAIPGVRRHQTGDREARMLFPAGEPETLRAVLAVIRPRVRRMADPARMAAIGAATRMRAK